jgi:AmmeMemoRadiSam system protein B
MTPRRHTGTWEGYALPLGDVKVDRAAVCSLSAAEPFELGEERQVCNHSVEIQLPFLRKAVRGALVIRCTSAP